MPRYSRKRRTRKRYTPRNKGKRTVKQIIPRSFGFPDTYKTKLRFTETYDLTTDSFHYMQYAWRLNSLFDPDFTSGSVLDIQPTYFDQLAAVYGRYRVYGAQVDLTVFNGQSGQPLYFSTITTGTESPAPSADPASISMNSNGSPLRLISSEGSNNVYTYTHYYPINEIFGVNKQAVLTEQNYSSQTTTSPNSTAVLWMDVESPGAGASFKVMANITYYCQFERISAVLES